MNTIRACGALLAVPILAIAMTGCDIDWTNVFDGNDNGSGNDNTVAVADTEVAGLNVAVSDYLFTRTFNNLQQAIERRNYDQTLTVDLQAEADAAGRDIRPTRVIMYEDPQRMTPIIAADRRAGLDLPPAILVYRTGDGAGDPAIDPAIGPANGLPGLDSGNVGVAYNSSDYLAARYDVADARDALDGLAEDIATWVGDAVASNGVSRAGGVDGIGRGEGIVDRISDRDFATTLDQLIDAINDNDDLELLQQFDHRAAAHAIGSMLDDNDDPATLVVFDAGAEQARMIAGGQTVAVDLPMRILVSEDTDGAVHVNYSKPGYLADRHGLDVPDAIDDLDGIMRDLVDKAID
ncbi:DUF302 domain-containing protein [Salinisphaera sp.]|uniref:DUF302 domain-containing protein n=1 Tax=Salinisphaera sp. TaxID=1914330 RepID=UPI002D79039C|nr:DUF302 domain-containing protein [Salinisphaera sp.]HET7314603.1 DUF302 domain-containing protein [Salinisphaera sp.]